MSYNSINQFSLKSSGEKSDPRVEVCRHSAQSPWTYSLLDVRQREVAHAIRTEQAPPMWLISEVAPVVTLGRRAKAESDLLWTESEFKHRGIDVVATDRGGLATYHGPGQWVVFYIDSLERMTGDPRGVKVALRMLLDLGLNVVRSVLGAEREAVVRREAIVREEPWTGVWTSHKSSQKKIASVGVAVDQGVLLHGLSINVFQTPQSFVGFNPCGLDAQMDYLDVSMDQALEAIARSAGFQFQLK